MDLKTSQLHLTCNFTHMSTVFSLKMKMLIEIGTFKKHIAIQTTTNDTIFFPIFYPDMHTNIGVTS